MHSWRSIFGLGLVFCSTAALAACTPPAASGNCSDDSDCVGRGQFCESVSNTCQDGEADYDSTNDDGAPGTFTDRPIPMFRGRVCSAPDAEVKVGTKIPLSFQPCLHPCMTPGAKKFQHQWSCLSGICSAMSVWYTMGDGDNCPDEAWGQFPESECQYLVELDMDDAGLSTSMGPVQLDGTPVEGVLRLEIPFLSNRDLAEIVAYDALEVGQQEANATGACVSKCDGKSGGEKSVCLENCMIKDLAFQYLEQDDRIIPFDMRSAHPDPPETCRENNPDCECFPIGFG